MTTEEKIKKAEQELNKAKKKLATARMEASKERRAAENRRKYMMKHPEYCDEYASGNLSINLYCDIMRNTPREIIAVSDLSHNLMQLRTQLAKSWKITDPRAEVKRAEYQKRPSRSPAKKREESL